LLVFRGETRGKATRQHCRASRQGHPDATDSSGHGFAPLGCCQTRCHNSQIIPNKPPLMAGMFMRGRIESMRIKYMRIALCIAGLLLALFGSYLLGDKNAFAEGTRKLKMTMASSLCTACIL
jgi:hypothetical protein